MAWIKLSIPKLGWNQAFTSAGVLPRTALQLESASAFLSHTSFLLLDVQNVSYRPEPLDFRRFHYSERHTWRFKARTLLPWHSMDISVCGQSKETDLNHRPGHPTPNYSLDWEDWGRMVTSSIERGTMFHFRNSFPFSYVLDWIRTVKLTIKPFVWLGFISQLDFREDHLRQLFADIWRVKQILNKLVGTYCWTARVAEVPDPKFETFRSRVTTQSPRDKQTDLV